VQTKVLPQLFISVFYNKSKFLTEHFYRWYYCRSKNKQNEQTNKQTKTV